MKRLLAAIKADHANEILEAVGIMACLAWIVRLILGYEPPL